MIEITPEQAGIPRADLSTLQLSDPVDISAALLCVLKGCGKREHRDAIALNTAAILYLAGVADDLKSGAELAIDALDSGRVAQRLEKIAEFTHGQ